MRLKTLEISGFRSFSKPAILDLDADVILLSGPNGTGKTSVTDAVLWAMCGNIPRLAPKNDAVISAYSSDGTARVKLKLCSDETEITIARAFDGERMSLMISDGESEWTQQDAEKQLHHYLFPNLGDNRITSEGLLSAMTRGVYLQQDVVTQFLEDDDHVRFHALGELVGTGKVAEFQKALESGRNAWSRVHLKRADEVKEAETQLIRFQSRLERLPEEEPDVVGLETRWDSWARNSREALDATLTPMAEFTFPKAISVADDLVRTLAEAKRRLDRRIQSMNELLNNAQNLDNSNEHVAEPANNVLVELTSKLEKARIEHDETQSKFDSAYQHAKSEQDRRSRLAVMAQIAAQHLEGQCPVCDQSIDKDKTRQRLEALISRGTEDVLLPKPSELEDSMSKIRNLEASLSKATRKIEDDNRRASASQAWRDRAIALCEEMGIGAPKGNTNAEIQASLVGNLEILNAARTIANDLVNEGEAILADTARVSEFEQRAELEAAHDEAEVRLGRLLDKQRWYQATHDAASRIINALRESAIEVIQSQISQIEPLLGKIYWRIDPHPAFTELRLDTRLYRGKGRTKVMVDDVHADMVGEQEPADVFSSSQLNALAVAVFLAFNLSNQNLPIRTAILDDPLQSLDDVNLLGLIDVLRRAKDKRQLVLTTHDQRFSRLLARKLRPTESGQSSVAITFNHWTREGPEFNTERQSGASVQFSVLKDVA